MTVPQNGVAPKYEYDECDAILPISVPPLRAAEAVKGS